MTATKCVIVPGNGGGGDIRGSSFYGWAEIELKGLGYDVRLPEGGMPDPTRAREGIWLPYMLDTLGCDENTVLIGHSSGAAAALRLAEKQRLKGLVVVAAYDSDLGDELERASGYFSRPWNWDAIKANCQFIVQLAGACDSLVPIEEQRKVAGYLSAAHMTYVELPNEDHFFEPPFNTLIESIQEKMAGLS